MNRANHLINPVLSSPTVNLALEFLDALGQFLHIIYLNSTIHSTRGIKGMLNLFGTYSGYQC